MFINFFHLLVMVRKLFYDFYLVLFDFISNMQLAHSHCKYFLLALSSPGSQLRVPSWLFVLCSKTDVTILQFDDFFL